MHSARITLFLFLVVCLVQGQTILPSDLALDEVFSGYEAAMVIRNLQTGAVSRYHASECRERWSPCSTYKIPHALIALETGVLNDQHHVLPWDGVEHPLSAWNRDLTLSEAIQVSSVPYFQQVSQKIGRDRMQMWIDSLHYGNQDISGELTRFWLGSTLTISCDEQVDFLTRLITMKLPCARHQVERIIRIIRQDTTNHGVWYGKTGGCGPDGITDHGWFVGFIEQNEQTWVYATLIHGGERPNGQEARRRCARALQALGLW